MSDHSRERDLVLAPNEYAFISDQTKGNINVYVGPFKTSLANTDQPVYFDEASKRFERCGLEQAIRIFATAPEGWYITLKNPAGDQLQPKNGTVNNLPELQVGHKINLPGPVSFGLWPGQMVRVLKGHHLRSNQYLLVRVYDEASARANWTRAVMKLQGSAAEENLNLAAAGEEALNLGQEMIIRGTEVSFYIPPTGIEVVPDNRGQLVREAVTLERLEYCILLDEDGNKRYIQGPDVVFPEPTERFVERQVQGVTCKKFRAVELNENSGIYVKVIAPYTEPLERPLAGAAVDGSVSDTADEASHPGSAGQERTGDVIHYAVGDELFITGKDQMIYFPRPEHAIIKYGEQDIHYAVAIPAGEGRYVMERNTGQIKLVKGPTMLLPDPRKEVIIRRVLTTPQVHLWFPGNAEALAYNHKLQDLLDSEGAGPVLPMSAPLVPQPEAHTAADPAKKRRGATPALAGEDFQRSTQYTPPRTITLNTKYDGAVAISVWTGYAILVVSKTGERKVVVGPQTYLLEYDEALEPMALSTGSPKTEQKLLKTVYLRVLHNKVSDRIRVETKDLCDVDIELSYRVNFEGESQYWFNVENYVKFLTEHMRSRIRNAVKQVGVEDFYSQATDILRDTVLGEAVDGTRKGCVFPENGMRVYDVEVLNVELLDDSVEKLLIQAQRQGVEQTLQLNAERRKLDFVQAEEAVKRDIADARTLTESQNHELALERLQREHVLALQALHSQTESEQTRLAGELATQEQLNAMNQARLGRERERLEQELSMARERNQQQLALMQGEVDAMARKAEAISPDLIAALQAFGDKALAERMAESMGPLAILGGTSVVDVLSQLLGGTNLEHLVRKALPLMAEVAADD